MKISLKKTMLLAVLFMYGLISFSQNIRVRATGTVGDEILELIVDEQVLTSWVLGTELSDYTYEGPSTGVFWLNYTNDEGDRDVQIDYIEVDGTRYDAEDQQTNTGSYANDACGGGEFTEYMYCSGYIEFNVLDASLDTDNDGVADVNDGCPNDPNKLAPQTCGCGEVEGTCVINDYQNNIKWTIAGGDQGLAACQSKFVGNIVPSSWTANPLIRDDWGTYWNQMSQENAGKWGVVEGTRDNYSWGDLDVMYNYCEENGVPFKHHVFIWGSQQPDWLEALSASEQLEEVEEWYSLFQQRYPKTAVIDVVNESLAGHAPDVAARDAMGGFNNGSSVAYLANHPYLAKYGYGTGWDYIIYAFAKARDYFPDAILVLNDYNIINNVSNLNVHLEIVNILKERNLIDAVGIQAHAFSVDNLSANNLESNLDRLATAGLPIHVTELDIRGDNGDEQQQLERYQRLFPIFYEHPSVAGVTLWGYVEGQNWFDYTGILNADGSERAAMTWLKQYMASQPCESNASVTLTSPTQDTSIVAPGDVYLSAEVSDADAIETLQFFVDGEQVGATEYLAPYFTTFTATQVKEYEITAVINFADGSSITSDAITIAANVPQSSYNDTPHLIPGLIEFEEYDLGGNGFAYLDNSIGSETGESFRDDQDVDIEVSTDEGNGYNVGWMTVGEWLEYTVVVQETDNYDLSLRVACDSVGRLLDLSVDSDVVVSGIEVPNTSGWQEWQTITVNNIPLTEGEHVVKVTLGGVDYANLNWMLFEKSVVSSLEDSHSMAEISVYPNPTNGIVNLSISTEWVVYNNLGLEICRGDNDIVDLRETTKGVYTLQIGNQNYLIMKK